MTKLIKAATARKRAESVDKLELVMERIAQGITDHSAHGGFHTYTCVSDQYTADVVERLRKAGYTVTEEFDWQPTGVSKKKGFFAKLFGGDDEPEVYLGVNKDYAELNISWAGPLDEPE